MLSLVHPESSSPERNRLLPWLFGLVIFCSSAVRAATQPCEELLNSDIANTSVLTASSVVGVLPDPDPSVPSSEGHSRDLGNKALLDLPPFCRVFAQLEPVAGSNIVIELWLPEEWNGKFLGIGNHGYAGEFERGYMAMGLNRGYAVATSDGGHSLRDSPGAEFSVDNEVAVDDFAWRAVHEMTVAAKALVKSHYGAGAEYAYFSGCSTGGRQGLREAQQFPDDYDGIVAGGAPHHWTGVMASQLWIHLAGNLDSGGRIAPAKLDLVRQAALAACDRADGIADDLISAPESCSWQPDALLCAEGDEAKNCLAPDEIDAVKQVMNPITSPHTGTVIYDGMPIGSAHLWATSPAAHMGDKLGRHATSYYRYVVTGNETWSPEGAEFYDLAWKSAKPNSAGTRINSINPNLAAFRENGGKLIQYHGWNDEAMPAGYNTRYYSEVVKHQPGSAKASATRDFYRLFMVPGMYHCRRGDGPSHFGGVSHLPLPDVNAGNDMLEALDLWVREGIAPDQVIATEYVDQDATPRQVKRQMPLCPYPEVAVYIDGDPERAESYACNAQ